MLMRCLAAWLVAVAPPALAQPDVAFDAPRLSDAPALPAAPTDFVDARKGPVRWEYPAAARAAVRPLIDALPGRWASVVEELGGDIEPELHIRIATNPEEMARLAPEGAPPPAYAVGVAYPSLGLVLLTLTAPQTWDRPDVQRVLVHELSHVALHRAVDGQPVPRWFTEGVAVHQSQERSLDRLQSLWRGAATGQLIGLDALGGRFPDRPHTVSLAYAQSADFVRWLLARPNGKAQFHELLGRLRRASSFYHALEVTYSTGPGALEEAWQRDLEARFQLMPLLFGSGGVWAFGALLLILGFIRRRRQAKTKLAAWARAEAEEDKRDLSATSALHDPPLVSLAHLRPAEARPSRDTPVPTIEHEGRNHTLH